MPDLARQLAPALFSAATVTDVGSVKEGVVNQLEAILGSQFVGSHPMAGSEQSGIDAARANLFESAVCIITPTENSPPEKVQILRELWQCVGCRIVEMSPREHDERVGRVSHMPHAIAATLVNAISLRVRDVGAIAGGGYRDTTRIAAGPAAMWREILLENRAALLAGLEDFSAMLDKMKDSFKTPIRPSWSCSLSAPEQFVKICHELGCVARQTGTEDWRPKSWCPATRASRIVPSCLRRSPMAYARSAISSKERIVSRTIRAFQQLGVTIERPDTGLVVVYGSHGKLTAPEADIDCGKLRHNHASPGRNPCRATVHRTADW